MKTIGLLGGMSWESTALYYKIINETVKEKLGGLHSAKILLYSVNFAEIEECQAEENWSKSAQILAEAGLKLEKAGADYLLICTNTMHKVAKEVQEVLTIPLIHLAQETAREIVEQGIDKVALLGTKYTMKEDFYKEKLIESGLEVLIPNDEDIEIVNSIIYKELCLGKIKETSREKYKEIIQKLVDEGAKGIILGCTEIALLINQKDVCIPVFDTTLIHAKKAALLCVENSD